MSSVVEVGTSSQSAERPALTQPRESGWPSGTKLTSSSPMPSSTNSKSFQSTPPEWGMPSRMPSRVSMTPMHFGPMLRTPSRSSVLIHELLPPGSPSNKPSRFSRTVAEFEPLTQAFAYMSPVAQSSRTLSSNRAKSYSKRSSNVRPPQLSVIVSSSPCRPSVDEITGESARLVMKGDDVTPTITSDTRRARNGAVKRLAITFGCLSPS